MLRVVGGFGARPRIRLGLVVLIGPALTAETARRQAARSWCLAVTRLAVILMTVVLLAVVLLAVALLRVPRLGAVALIGGRLGRRPVTRLIAVARLVAIARLVR